MPLVWAAGKDVFGTAHVSVCAPPDVSVDQAWDKADASADMADAAGSTVAGAFNASNAGAQRRHICDALHKLVDTLRGAVHLSGLLEDVLFSSFVLSEKFV